MSVSAEEVLRLARLAELAIDPAELPALTTQLDRIVGFVAQLSGLEAEGRSDEGSVGTASARLRADEVRPATMARGPAEFAPEFVEGFFVVPRLGTMDEA